MLLPALVACGAPNEEPASTEGEHGETTTTAPSEPSATTDPDGTTTEPAAAVVLEDPGDPELLCAAARACCQSLVTSLGGSAASRARVECEGLEAVASLGGGPAAAGCRGALESWRAEHGERAACATPVEPSARASDSAE